MLGSDCRVSSSGNNLMDWHSKSMTGAELRSIRQSLGLTLSGMGKALGYSGNKNTLSVQIRRFESGARVIPNPIAVSARNLGARLNKGVA
jgi:transcriptional regulator with XRE-family HTH domain